MKTIALNAASVAETRETRSAASTLRRVSNHIAGFARMHHTALIGASAMLFVVFFVSLFGDNFGVTATSATLSMSLGMGAIAAQKGGEL